MKTVTINLGKRSYSILIGSDILHRLGGKLLNLDIGKDAFVITNNTIGKSYAEPLKKILISYGFSVKVENIPDTEKSKSQSTAIRLINRIVKYDIRKRLFIIALGGGVVGDLAGFVASVYKRGIPYIQIPTTLLAQVDSSIGGKVAIDLESGKNLVGSFYQPSLVFSEINFLKTLNKRQIISGLAEVIKYAVISDAGLFRYLEKRYKKILSLEKTALEYVIYRCSKIKAMVIKEDERETKGRRTILNYGHTIGHAIEAASSFKRYAHGEAIAIGMTLAAEISCRLRILNKKELERITGLINRVGLPTKIHKVNQSRIWNAIFHDKKFIHGKNRFVLPKEIGKVIIYEDVPLKLVNEVLTKGGT